MIAYVAVRTRSVCHVPSEEIRPRTATNNREHGQLQPELQLWRPVSLPSVGAGGRSNRRAPGRSEKHVTRLADRRGPIPRTDETGLPTGGQAVRVCWASRLRRSPSCVEEVPFASKNPAEGRQLAIEHAQLEVRI